MMVPTAYLYRVLGHEDRCLSSRRNVGRASGCEHMHFVTYSTRLVHNVWC
jgi:hypothetical protein